MNAIVTTFDGAMYEIPGEKKEALIQALSGDSRFVGLGNGVYVAVSTISKIEDAKDGTRGYELAKEQQRQLSAPKWD